MSTLEDDDLQRASAFMSSYCHPWAIAGGWAIDLFVGRQTRDHADVDVAVLRPDQEALRAYLSDLSVAKVRDGVLEPWLPDETLPASIHEIWATWPDGWRLELLLNDCDAATKQWIYRRDPRVRRALVDAIRVRETTPYLSPEIVLLYKAKAPDAKDESDFGNALPNLTAEQRRWLADALSVAHTGHPWRARLTD